MNSSKAPADPACSGGRQVPVGEHVRSANDEWACEAGTGHKRPEKGAIALTRVLALILAGGQGDRLSILSDERAKPAVISPVNIESSTSS